MRTIAFHNRYGFGRNVMFTQREAPIGDGLLAPFVALAKAAEAVGVEVLTLDMANHADAIVFVDMPYIDDSIGRQALSMPIPKFLITFEPPVVLTDNWQGLGRFTKVFTWSDSLVAVDPEMFVKIHYSREFPPKAPRLRGRRPVTMIASNKRSTHPESLYDARRETIEWFERNHPRDFDLYGPGWPTGLRTYYGAIPPGCKGVMLSHYAFAICYENQRAPGYISEKILDCFAAGTIPVYNGAPNVTDYIPPECFIDRRMFSDHEELYTFLKTATPEWIEKKLAAIDAWLQSESARRFSVERFVSTILTNV